MPPDVYTPLIEEAHKHGMIVHAHATNLQDQKGVVKAGVDVLVHTLAAEKVDDEFIAILKEKRPYWAPVMGLGDRSELCDGNNPFIEQMLPDSVIADIKAGKTWLPSPPCSAPASAQFAQREENLKYNFPKYIAAGARIVLGTRRRSFRQVLVRLRGAPRDRNVREAGDDAGGGDRRFHVQAHRSAA